MDPGRPSPATLVQLACPAPRSRKCRPRALSHRPMSCDISSNGLNAAPAKRPGGRPLSQASSHVLSLGTRRHPMETQGPNPQEELTPLGARLCTGHRKPPVAGDPPGRCPRVKARAVPLWALPSAAASSPLVPPLQLSAPALIPLERLPREIPLCRVSAQKGCRLAGDGAMSAWLTVAPKPAAPPVGTCQTLVPRQGTSVCPAHLLPPSLSHPHPAKPHPRGVSTAFLSQFPAVRPVP